MVDSIEAFRAAHPEITDKDIDEVTAEARALVGPMGFGPDLLGPIKPTKPGRKKKAASSDSSKTKRQTSRGGDAYQLKITLRHSKPPIWRRVVVPADLTLGGLHAVIQIAMGWQDCHLLAPSPLYAGERVGVRGLSRKTPDVMGRIGVRPPPSPLAVWRSDSLSRKTPPSAKPQAVGMVPRLRIPCPLVTAFSVDAPHPCPLP